MSLHPLDWLDSARAHDPVMAGCSYQAREWRERTSTRTMGKRSRLSRNTIRKYLRAGEAEPHYAKRVSPSKLDLFASKLSGWLKTEAGRSRKQRRTVMQMHVDLQALGYRHQDFRAPNKCGHL